MLIKHHLFIESDSSCRCYFLLCDTIYYYHHYGSMSIQSCGIDNILNIKNITITNGVSIAY